MNGKTWCAILALALAAAMGLAPPASAGEKTTVLVYSLCKGFRHGGAIETGNPILKRIAQELGYECVVSEDPAVFDPDTVDKWDVIIYNNPTGQLNPEQEARREALMARIRGGAGFMGFHAATDCNYRWQEYGDMVNAYFAGHPWNQTVRSRIEDPDHALMKPFEKPYFEVKDEIYQFRNYKRSDVRVLMSIDPTSVDISRGRREDRDYAMCWVRTWGKGRVYYNAHGHYGHVFEDETFQQHVKLAMQWAAGDIEVDTTPSKEIDREALAAKALRDLRAAATDAARIAALQTLAWCPTTDALPLVVDAFDVNQEVAAAAAAAAAGILAEVDDVPRERRVAVLKAALPLARQRNVRRSIRDQLLELGVTDLPVKVPPGYVAHWWVAGPVPKAGQNLFETALPPEKGVDLDEGFAWNDATYAWKPAVADFDGIVDLNQALKRASNVAGFMYTEVQVENPTQAELRLGSDDGFVLWLNGQRLGGKDVSRAIRPGSETFKATLQAGTNKVLLKVLQGGGDWSGCLQLVSPEGKPLDFQVRKKK
ncbi:MAG: ThuA domain-containing protein [Candidatus Brocadiia bacterium]